jgi:hypothetical protein
MRTYQITIDEDVPVSQKRTLEKSRYCHPLSWLLPKLKQGESFIYPASTGEAHNGLRALCYQFGKAKGRKFATRAVEDREGVKRLRIWRTA